MARFREEVYGSRAYKAEIARRRKSATPPVADNARASRAQYLEKPSPVRKAINKAQARLNDF